MDRLHYAALHLRAPNDRNGNPVRAYVILETSYDADATRPLAFAWEDFRGSAALDHLWKSYGLTGHAPEPFPVTLPNRKAIRQFEPED